MREQDDLAEQVVASPSGEFDDILYASYDPFDYWIDIDDCTDGYVDTLSPRASKAISTQLAGLKRKREAGDSTAVKKRRTSEDSRDEDEGLSLGEIPPVTWLSVEEKQRIGSERHPRTKGTKCEPVTILKDWRERFKDSPGFATRSKADEADEAIQGPEIEDYGSVRAAEDEDDASQDGDENGLSVDALKSAILKNLGALDGLPAGLDETTLLEYVTRMMKGDGKADALLGKLTDEIFEEADDSDVEDIQNWASKRKGTVNEQKSAAAGAEKQESASNSNNNSVNGDSEHRKEYTVNGTSSNKVGPAAAAATPVAVAAAATAGSQSHTRKRKTTEKDCSASVKSQGTDREMLQGAKKAKVV